MHHACADDACPCPEASLSLSSDIQCSIDGNARARTRLARHLTPRLRRMASHYARRSGEDADDLLQEAWLGLFEAVPEVDLGIGQPEQFLLQRARWRLLAAIRHGRLRRTSPLEDAPEPEVLSSEVPEADFVARLGKTQRALASCLLAGLTFREAGEELGCSSANVAYHARRLREAFVEWHGEPLAQIADP